MGVITGVHAGGAAATFANTLIPAGSRLMAGTVLINVADDPLAVVVSAPDGMSGSITYPAPAVGTTSPASFNITVSGTGFDTATPPNPVPFTHVFNWPILQAPPPPPVSATDVDQMQTS